MTLEQLEKFCSDPRDRAPEFTRKPFLVEGWRIATDGFTLVAENGFSSIKLPELEPCANRDYILKLLAVESPLIRYSIDHLKGFLGDNETVLQEPILFNGHRVDKTKLRKVFTLCDEAYSFAVSFNDHGNEKVHTLHFRFGKIIAIVMGMREPSPDDPRYEPKLIQEKVLP